MCNYISINKINIKIKDCITYIIKKIKSNWKIILYILCITFYNSVINCDDLNIVNYKLHYIIYEIDHRIERHIVDKENSPLNINGFYLKQRLQTFSSGLSLVKRRITYF